jgi:hypothetical protein
MSLATVFTGTTDFSAYLGGSKSIRNSNIFSLVWALSYPELKLSWLVSVIWLGVLESDLLRLAFRGLDFLLDPVLPLFSIEDRVFS